MLYNFLENITWNADITLTESILDGYMAIFEAELKPIEYSSENGSGGTFITSKGNRVEVTISGYGESRDISFTTNNAYAGEGHNDPEILPGVFYVVYNEIKKLLKDHKLTAITFYGTEEEFRYPKYPSIMEHVNHTAASLKSFIELFNKYGKSIPETFLRYITSDFRDMNIYMQDIIKGKLTPSMLIDATQQIGMQLDRSRYYINRYDDTEDMDDSLKTEAHRLINDIKTSMNDIVTNYKDSREKHIKDRGDMTKRSQAYKTLTRRYFPNVKVSTEGNNVTLHLPEEGLE